MDIRKIISEEIEKILLFEEEDIPDDVVKATREVIKKLKEYVNNNVAEGDFKSITSFLNGLKAKKYIKNNIEFTFDDLFFREIVINLILVKPEEGEKFDEETINTNNTADVVHSFNFGRETGRIERINLDLNFCYNEKIDNIITYAIVSHELTHPYEFYMKKSNYITAKQYLYNSVYSASKKDEKIFPIVFLFYCMCYFELNANIVALYYELMKNKSADNYSVIVKHCYKQTSTYKESFIFSCNTLTKS